jgi:hypothetical protein
MFINKNPKNTATVKVTVNGAKLAASGTRYDFGKSNPGTQYMVPGVAANDLGNSFSVTVPSYTITDLIIQGHSSSNRRRLASGQAGRIWLFDPPKSQHLSTFQYPSA